MKFSNFYNDVFENTLRKIVRSVKFSNLSNYMAWDCWYCTCMNISYKPTPALGWTIKIKNITARSKTCAMMISWIFSSKMHLYAFDIIFNNLTILLDLFYRIYKTFICFDLININILRLDLFLIKKISNFAWHHL